MLTDMVDPVDCKRALNYCVFVVMVVQDVGIRGDEGLDLSKGNEREKESSQESYDGKGVHWAQYGAEPRERQGAGSGVR